MKNEKSPSLDGFTVDFFEIILDWFKHILFNRYKRYTEYIRCKHTKDKNEIVNAYRVLFLMRVTI